MRIKFVKAILMVGREDAEEIEDVATYGSEWPL